MRGASERTANWWLPSCGLSGGSLDGLWAQPMGRAGGLRSDHLRELVGHTGSPGMAGPKLSGSSTSCLFDTAKAISFASVTNGGTIPGGC